MTDNAKPGELMPDEYFIAEDYCDMQGWSVFKKHDEQAAEFICYCPEKETAEKIKAALQQSPPVQSDEVSDAIDRLVHDALHATDAYQDVAKDAETIRSALIRATVQRVAPQTGVDKAAVAEFEIIGICVNLEAVHKAIAKALAALKGAT